MIRKLLFLLMLTLLVSTVSADYTLQFQALTNSPADGATVYVGVQPVAPTSTPVGTQVVPTAGIINVTEIYDYSGTAGTNQEIAYYLRVNNATDYLVAKVSVAASERIFTNSSMEVAVAAGDTIILKRVQPTWTTNPLTNIVGGYALIDTPDETDRGYSLYGMALSNSPADSVTNYIGGKPAVPSTTEGQDKIFIPTSGSFTQGLVSDFSGTAGTAEPYAYYLDVNGTDYLIENRSVSQTLRFFNNTSGIMNIPVNVGNYLEFRRNHPAWATNPLTNVVGATAWVNTTDIHNINDGYPIHTFALTHTPADGQTVYYGYRPIAPSTTANTNKMYIQQAGTIKKVGVYSYSGTAGTGEEWSQYIVVNNADTYLIATVSSATNERMWINLTMNITVAPGDYIEMKSVQPTFVTNPATTIYGGGFYMEYEDELPTPSFTSTTPYGNPPHNVTFTDTSSVLDPLEYSWWWTNVENSTAVMFNASQNPDEQFDLGHFYISHGVSNASGYSNTTGTYLISVTESGGYTGLTHQDIFMESQKTLTLNFKSSTNGELIPVVQVYNQVDATTVNTTNGTFIGTYSFGTQAFIFHSEGYASRIGSYYVDDNVEYTVQMVPVAPSSNPNTNIIYVPRLVRLRAVDNWRTPLTPVTITANYISDTLPNNDPTYLQNAFGISSDVVALMMNSSVAMSGVTGSDGSNTFSMFPALTYNITVTNETMGVHCQQNLAPADTDYVLFCPTDAQKAVVVPLSQTLNRSYIWITEPNASFVTINASYQDPDGLTSNVLFNVSVVDNNTVIYSRNFGNPGTSQVLDNYTMPNIRGMQITSYLAYNRSAS